jgi:hypothetical protein
MHYHSTFFGIGVLVIVDLAKYATRAAMSPAWPGIAIQGSANVARKHIFAHAHARINTVLADLKQMPF